MKRTILLALCLAGLSAQGQIQRPNNETFNELAFFVGTNNPIYDEAEGSRYLLEEFVSARINGMEKVQLLRFNVVENSIEIKRENGEVMGLDRSTPYRIALLDGSGRWFETRPYRDERGKLQTTFFERLHRGEGYTLYFKENIKFVPKKPAKSSYEQDVPAKFKREGARFYLQGLGPEGEVVELPRKRKNLVPLFGERAGEMEKHIKKQKLDPYKREDLVKLLDFYFKAS
ncbi:hypothetical protein WIW50_15860 [Flavobacteriaceae bacterium 3-367]|uniref:hypothetical protein n=1 Tax=Eudoraea algarum TaxID=3417568 RepID=UPI0032754C3E